MKYLPDRKILAGGVSAVVVWAIMLGLSYAGVTVPADVQTALVALVGWAIAYLVPPSEQDILKRLDDGLKALAPKDPPAT